VTKVKYTHSLLSRTKKDFTGKTTFIYEREPLKLLFSPTFDLTPFRRCTTSGQLECCPDGRPATRLPCRGD